VCSIDDMPKFFRGNIIKRMIRTTGFDFYKRVEIEKDDPPRPSQLSLDELQVERELENYYDPEDRTGRPDLEVLERR